ncbi:malignant fibrous histiocytoma-amplified sequence 1 homolog isoform X2 [Gigantopelta aegis]|uniref:malignant fibrous histiocytoma-amplified sequence 1 homolog isoform X2 n=1 Tax=Gigantopelta aegis TaxID=1735272 RepID=UPI001B88C765|nr:malignant fibrous histiocytoma-amplified sequence 1 homolog isoform X2 [Gigantopelta aegis]
MSVTKMATARPATREVRNNYTGPYGRSPITHVGFCEARHLHPERLPSAKPEKAVSVRLLDTSNETIKNIQQLADSLKRLLVYDLSLKTIPDGLLANLFHLEKLDLGFNHLSDHSFPDSVKGLENLIEVRLNNNTLTVIPQFLRRLRKLNRLDVSSNELESLKGVERLKRIQVLVLDGNNLGTVFKDVAHMTKLEILRCKDNNIREITPEIRQLKQLQDLDISNNKITVLPIDVFLLPKLDSFNASYNQITKVPTFNVNVQSKHWVSSIDLSENSMTKFPGHLMLMSKKLDLSSNKLKVLSWNSIKKLEWNTDQEMFVEENPLTYPPADVCDSGLRSIMSFFQESQAEAKTYQGVKILMIGSRKSGKTSLIHSLIDQQPRLSQEFENNLGSVGIETYDTSFDYDVEEGRPGRSLHLNIWDLCGHPFYLYPHYLFLEQPSIAILTFNMAEYTEENFDEMVGTWFDWMIAKTNKLVVLLVGTHSDQVPRDKLRHISVEVPRRLTSHLDNRRKMIQEKIKVIEAKPEISPTLSEQLKTYVKLLQDRCTVQTEVIVTSSAVFKGFDILKMSIEALANQQKIFPNVMRVIPIFWVEVETYLEERGNTMAVPVMEWDEYAAEISHKFGMKHLIDCITQYLHDTGKVLWFSKVPKLKTLVFLRPSWLFDIFRQIFRHDFADKYDYLQEDRFKTAGLSQGKFDRLKQEVLAEGIIDKDFIKAAISNCFSNDLNNSFQKTLTLLHDAFEIGYPVSKRTKDKFHVLTVDKDGEGRCKISKLLIPWLRKTPEPNDLRQEWDKLSERRKLAVVFKFPRYMPPGLFELLCVRANHDKYKLNYVFHWGGGIHATHKEHPVRLIVMYNREGTENQRDVVLRIESRDNSDSDDQVPACTMWGIILPLLLEFEEILKGYAGIWVERRIECPLCGTATFLGEWLTPKETQGFATKTCDACGQEVDTAFLVHPREKKRVPGIIKTLRKMRLARTLAIEKKEVDTTSS